MEINYQKPLVLLATALTVLTALTGNVWLAVVAFACLSCEVAANLVEMHIKSRKIDQYTDLNDKIALLNEQVTALKNSLSMITGRRV